MHNRISSALAALLIMSLTGCDARSKSPPIDSPWTKLPDGSWLSKPYSDVEAQMRTVTRCWKAAEKFDCLDVFDNKSDIQAKRFKTTKLGDLDQGDEGYVCLRSDRQIIESISKALPGSPASTLTSNTFDMGSDRFWTRKYAETYMKNNGVDPASYFDCSKVMSLLKVGSFMSIGTTDVTYEWLTGPAR